MAEAHNCREHVVLYGADNTEPHGERFFDTWWHCTVCGEDYDECDLEAMAA